MSKIFAVVPMRSGSSLADKNIRMFHGMPLFYWTIRKLKKLKAKGLISNIIISTDSRQYYTYIKNFFNDPMDGHIHIRLPELATAQATTESVVEELVSFHHSGAYGINVKEDTILLVEPTSPLVPYYKLHEMVKLPESVNAESSVLVTRDTSQFWRCSDGKWQRQYSERLMRQQNRDGIFKEVGVWSFTIPSFIKANDRLGADVEIFEVSPEYGLSINTEIDFKICEELFSRNEGVIL